MDLGSWSRRSVVHTRSTLEGDRTPRQWETVQATLSGCRNVARAETNGSARWSSPSKFGSGNHTIFRSLAYGQEPGQVTASAENVVTILQASCENGLKAQIFVTAKDTGAVQDLCGPIQEESPQISA